MLHSDACEKNSFRKSRLTNRESFVIRSPQEGAARRSFLTGGLFVRMKKPHPATLAVIANHQPSLTLSMVAFLRFGNLFCRFTLVPVLLW